MRHHKEKTEISSYRKNRTDEYDGAMLKATLFLFALMVAASAQDSAHTAGPFEDSPSTARTEAQIWDLEKAYWEYVKANDLEKYRALWHDNFLGWPFVSSAQVRKDRITDWITANAAKGIKLQSYSIDQLAIQVTGDVAINHYRIKATWANGEGAEARTDALRITHTWIRTNGTWEIIGGMSAPMNVEGK